MKTERLPCGCRHERDRERYIELCPACRADYDARHRAHREDLEQRREGQA